MNAHEHTVVFEWNLDEFRTLVANCEYDDTVALGVRFLPKEGKILEAGCGPGHVVRYLLDRGYDIEGIEINDLLVKTLNERWTDFPVRWGDVAKVPVPDGYYSGLLSFGVIEHFLAGPEEPLSEHYRVLRPGGIAVISVPALNWFVRIGSVLGRVNPKRSRLMRKLFGKPVIPRNIRGRDGFRFHVDPQDGKFFQYHFTVREFESVVRAAGFCILQSLPTHYPAGLWVSLGGDWVMNKNRHFVFTQKGAILDGVLRRFSSTHNLMHTIVAKK